MKFPWYNYIINSENPTNCIVKAWTYITKSDIAENRKVVPDAALKIYKDFEQVISVNMWGSVMVIGLANGISRQSLKLLRRHQISPLSFPSTDMANEKKAVESNDYINP